MAEITIIGQEPFGPSASVTASVFSDSAFPPFLRGPMYSAYAELREWKLRLKKAGLSPSCPIMKRGDASASLEARSVPEISTDFRKENRKPKIPMAQRFSQAKELPSLPVARMFDSSRTPAAASRPEMRRVGSMSAGKVEGMRGGSVLGGCDCGDDFLLMRSFSGYPDLASRNDEDGRRGRAGGKGIFRKTFTGFRRSTAKATGWIG